MENLLTARSIYGIDLIRIAPTRDEIMVEYDATRLHVPELEAALERAGIPVASVYSAS